jgi:YD repeat-containing protein
VAWLGFVAPTRTPTTTDSIPHQRALLGCGSASTARLPGAAREGAVIRRTLPLGMSESMTYDAQGNRASRRDFNVTVRLSVSGESASAPARCRA